MASDEYDLESRITVQQVDSRTDLIANPSHRDHGHAMIPVYPMLALSSKSRATANHGSCEGALTAGLGLG